MSSSTTKTMGLAAVVRDPMSVPEAGFGAGCSPGDVEGAEDLLLVVTRPI
jgi:hypothetical protein